MAKKAAKRPTCSKHGRAWRKGGAKASAASRGLNKCRHHPEQFQTKANGQSHIYVGSSYYMTDTASQIERAKSALRGYGMDSANVYAGLPGPDAHRNGQVLFAGKPTPRKRATKPNPGKRSIGRRPQYQESHGSSVAHRFRRGERQPVAAFARSSSYIYGTAALAERIRKFAHGAFDVSYGPGSYAYAVVEAWHSGHPASAAHVEGLLREFRLWANDSPARKKERTALSSALARRLRHVAD